MSTMRRGLTLIELIVVLVILVALAAIVVPMLTGANDNAQATVTQSNMRQLADLLVRYRVDNSRLPRPGFVDLSGGRPNAPQLRYLFVNPGAASNAWPGPLADPTGTTINTFDAYSKTGWNGPYYQARSVPYSIANGYTAEFGSAGDPAVPDLWNHPIVLVTRLTTTGRFTWLQSAGADGILDVPAAADLTGPPGPANILPGANALTVFPTTTGSRSVDDVTLLLPFSE